MSLALRKSEQASNVIQLESQAGPATNPRASALHADYWRGRLFHKRKTVAGKPYVCPGWSVKIQHAGRREAFALDHLDARKAAAQAKEIAAYIKSSGWDAAVARYKRGVVLPVGPMTIGQFLEATGKRFTKRPSTLALYQSYLRRIAADIAGHSEPSSKFDSHGTGNATWHHRIDTLPIAILTPQSLTEWQTRYVEAAGHDPVAKASASRSAASILRCARALFCPQLTAGLEIQANPFAAVKIRAPRAERYRSNVNPDQLIANARRDLIGTEPQTYLALLLCLFGGLRKREADLLMWAQVDETASQIRVGRTRYFEPKTEESTRAVDVPASVMAEIVGFRTAGAQFVLAGKAPRLAGKYSFYRCEDTWLSLAGWLRTQGISEQKAIHALRKESGSLIASQFGIEAARAHLGHRDVTTTSSFYVTKKERREVSLK